MNAIEAIRVEAFRASPFAFFKTEADAAKVAEGMMETADEGETFEVVAYQGNRFVIANRYLGEFVMYL